ncbi:MAG: 3-mercaptopyruvate sulfurtransferase [Candidatus Brevundimonas colombiensis]|uniref:3-mercaptopyruvate sulfurtransferase n=1 Tax=Candidatus Brevundimonas colombiensis TaxID=3121376 RepID=A0AAJ6BLA3_9CAUL|nr:3-mercaptopyruvate sulfurtransferase [Brevundimonas sp.]WEK39381.1 MAG: 3-mercaptopyruvate sulfurtransferase [Brevundimonas sp.]
MSFLISVEDLAAQLDQPNLRIVDASWHLDGRDARADFEQAHIPGAVFFDLDAVSDRESPLPHMMPTPAAFAEAVGALGVAADDRIVVYDTVGLFSAARVWWMFRTMGARDVRVLDGGLPLWRARGLGVEQGAASPEPAVFDALAAPGAVAALDDVRAALDGGDQVIDARGAARFTGQAAEPRPGVRGGHMPGALNVPFGRLLDPDGRMKRGDALAQAFADAGVDVDKPAITTCGSGVTAAILTLGLAELGRSSRLYDGSWSEWGSRQDTPVAVSP